MIEHVSKRRGRREIGPGGKFTEGATGHRALRVTSGAGRLLPLVLASLLCSCERGVSPVGGGPGAQSSASRPALGTASAPAGGGAPAQPSGTASGPPIKSSGDSPDEWVTLGKEVEPWLILALETLASKGRIDLDLPLAMHLPLLASPRSDAITPRQLMDHTAHLGADAYEDFLRANPGSGALKAQAFLVALGCDDTPGERSKWRHAHLDTMGWLLLASTGAQDLAGALGHALGDSVQMQEGGPEPITSIRGEVRVLASRDAEVRRAWGLGR